MSVLRIAMEMVLVALVAVGCTSPSPKAPIVAARPVVDSGLGRGDVFDVRVFTEPDLSGAYRVDSEGAIDFPLIGRVVVAGHLAGDVAGMLRERLATYVRQPQVTVFVREVNSKHVTVYGQVQHPGTFPYADSMTLSQAVSLAGGCTSMAAPSKVRITRVEHDVQHVIEVDLQAIAEGKVTNLFLLPGDELYIPAWMF